MLSPEQVRAFYDVGWVLVPAVFTPAEVQRMRGAFERLEHAALALGASGMHGGSQFVLSQAATGAVRIDRVVWCGAVEPELERLGADGRLLAMAAELLGSRRMTQLINQAHFKLPGDGVDFPWHQDSSHRRYGGAEWRDVNGRGSYVQTLTAIDDVTTDNGPLELIPGSCRLGHVGLPEGELPPDLDPRDAVAATMEAGGVLLFGPYTFHRSLPNDSARPRRVFINGFASPGANARVYPGCGMGKSVEAPRAAGAA
jgi:ectoine hydroxylase-related dioxygenase (phytanoyl-CoA dioxygenase family)